ncbi:MAG: preprotein translocase subunit SecE [Chitinophagales bacterium]|jgi:preprotein translocase subunit SecE|nr:preprotein translocase subunit SecE [Chitinophagales bacterium]
MNQIRTFFSETSNELLNKVSWPTWEELQSSTVVVTVAALILAFIIFLMDKAANFAMSTFYHLF